ncbi:MAG: 6-carboxytetrahydropterin synthase [Sedimentisphaerales bacterium]|jgi:6-pyruvoyltetrahydropterin/6-carboxytetrahydropterin synthase|nr:6-carboxytetrahydropterin synthase [Sedimentisphaerales bacterium]
MISGSGVYRLTRFVPITIDPFTRPKAPGSQAGQLIWTCHGLGISTDLGVTVAGPADPRTGFVVDIRQIDQLVNRLAAPVFFEQVQAYYCAARSIDPQAIVRLLSLVWQRIEGPLGGMLAALDIRLGHCCRLSIHQKEAMMYYLTRWFEFSAAHTLWNRSLSEAQNHALFGICANPNGHGHNYRLEITLRIAADSDPDMVAIERIIRQQVVDVLDHKNLNLDVPFFADVIPTMEQIARFAWESLEGRLSGAQLDCIKVWESERSSCAFYGPGRCVDN